MPKRDGSRINGAQLRAARALLRWSAEELASRTRLGVATIRRAEAQDGTVSLTRANSNAIVSALEAAGVRFIPENGGGVGAKLREPQGSTNGLVLTIRNDRAFAGVTLPSMIILLSPLQGGWQRECIWERKMGLLSLVDERLMPRAEIAGRRARGAGGDPSGGGLPRPSRGRGRLGGGRRSTGPSAQGNGGVGTSRMVNHGQPALI